jgi:hypothetical protein|tara:strand:+ start:419 stop:1606 length:1188 start_codon:yes stop_codon:yes gene_type:complete
MEFKSFSQYLSEAKGEVYFVFGRFNPPTPGHDKLFDVLKKTAGSNPYRVYASKSQDAKKNPLSFKDKIKFMRKMFPKHARSIMADADVRTALDICVKLYKQGFTSVTMVAGSDRLQEFQVLLNKYNGVDSRHGFYNFENEIKVVSAGKRDPEAEGVKGMSASKLRALVAAGDLQGFADASLEIPGDGIQSLYNAIRKGMGLKKESVRKHTQLEPVSENREAFVKGNLFKEGDEVVLKETNQVGVIKRCGTNFLVVEFGEWKKRVWLDDVEHLEEKKYSDMDAKQKAAHNKPRPNAPESDHTKDFKKKFGEMKSFSQSLEEADAKKALQNKADKTKMPYGILKKVFDRGYAAWSSSHRPGTNPTQWGLARVNSFATKSKGTWGGADKDLAAKVRGS